MGTTFGTTAESQGQEPAKLLLDTPDEVAMAIACQLGCPLDLLRLGVACRRFRLKTLADPRHDSATADAPPEMWSIVSEAARRSIAGDARVPRRPGDCWLGLMNELRLLRAPLKLDLRTASGWSTNPREDITLSEGDAVVTKLVPFPFGFISLATNDDINGVMRSGRHRARFTVLESRVGYTIFGVARPSWGVSELHDGRDLEYGMEPQAMVDLCFYDTCQGTRYPNGQSWEGMQVARWEEGRPVPVVTTEDVITMDLDLETGTMTVWKNEERLGLMATGLSGEYVWTIVLVHDGDSVRIESAPGPMPPAPTAEDVTAAELWIEEHNVSESDDD